MTSPGEYAVFALSFAASAGAPGPEIAAVLGRALSRGLRGCVPLALGITLGKLFMLSAAIIGLAALIAALGPVFTVVQYGGAAYLLYLGVRKWRRARDAVAEGKTDDRDRFWTQTALGLGLTLSNPIALAFYIALLPGVIEVSEITLDTYLVLAGIIVVVMTLTVIAYGFAAEVTRKLIAGNRAKFWIDRLAGAMFATAGIWVAIRPSL